ncbi:MAG: hypothetical protein HY905_09765 [Deltaproteobacteria bacterium]|nr:hypothetical protein [Deltaproteobacteria bacterium]
MNRVIPALALVCIALPACSGINLTGNAEGDGGVDADAPRPDGIGPDGGADDDSGGEGLDAGEEDAADGREDDGEDAAGDAADPPEAAVLPAVCGDGVVDPGEECDDGDRRDDACRWDCRLGGDEFEYPPPDPAAPRIAPSGPPVAITDDSEVSLRVSSGFFRDCHPLGLAANGGRFAVAYPADQPYEAVRVRFLDRDGRTIAGPWEHETPWGLPSLAFFATGEGYGMLAGSYVYGIQRSRFASDGAALEEFLTLRSHEESPIPLADMVGGAATSGRWLAVSSRFVLDWQGWRFEAFTDAGAPAGSLVLSFDEATECVSAVPAGDGFAVGDGTQVVVLDADLRVASWSGALMHDVAAGVMCEAPGGFWTAWQSRPVSPDPPFVRNVWVASVDPNGAPRFPARQILTHVPRAITPDGDSMGPTAAPAIALAAGPAGVALVWWEGVGDDETPGGPVMLLTLDPWGNVVTPATPVLAEGEITTMGWVLAAAADDLGYAVVTAVQGEVLGTAHLVFRHFAVTP